jgi:hypothetical protein
MTSSVGLSATSGADWQIWPINSVKRVAKRKDKKHPHPRMHQPQRTADSNHSQAKSQSDADERRARRREEGVLSRIEDITYKVLRKHEPKKP